MVTQGAGPVQHPGQAAVYHQPGVRPGYTTYAQPRAIAISNGAGGRPLALALDPFEAGVLDFVRETVCVFALFLR